MTSPLVWFDIPARDLDRAVAFYAAVLARPIAKQQFREVAIALLPHDEGEVAGCLYPSDDLPGGHGPLLYFSCAGRLDEAVALVEPNGGKVLKGRHPIGPYGFRALVVDSEGNRIALHSPI
jgi:predicted enzyme related to lactoylglutathione lyase